MPTSFGSSGGGQVMYEIFLKAFEWALPMNAYPSMPMPIVATCAIVEISTRRRLAWL